MPQYRPIRAREACLGIKYSLTSDEAQHVPQLKAIIDALTSLSDQYHGYTLGDLHGTDFRQNVQRVFHKLGPSTWPGDDSGITRFEYLVDGVHDTLEGWYPQPLYYAEEDDAAM